jgi:hypothetical protein
MVLEPNESMESGLAITGGDLQKTWMFLKITTCRKALELIPTNNCALIIPEFGMCKSRILEIPIE